MDKEWLTCNQTVVGNGTWSEWLVETWNDRLPGLKRQSTSRPMLIFKTLFCSLGFDSQGTLLCPLYLPNLHFKVTQDIPQILPFVSVISNLSEVEYYYFPFNKYLKTTVKMLNANWDLRQFQLFLGHGHNLSSPNILAYFYR